MNEVASLLGIGMALLIGAVSPGPSFIVVARSAVSFGRYAGVHAALGMGTGAMLFAVAALLGLNAVLMAVPKLYGAIKLAGGIYLAYLGVRLWQGAKLPLDVSLSSSPRLASDTRRHYFLGLFTQVSNPKTAIVYASVFAAFLPASPSLGFCAVVCALVFVVEVGWYATIAMALSSARARATYLRCKTPVDRFSGAIMAALGAKLAVSGLND